MNINDKVPDLLGLDQNGEDVKLSSFDTQKFIIYFYPKDSTPGCTAESCSLRDSNDEFLAKGYQVIGVSANDAKSHQRFIAKNSLPFPLVADTEHKLCEQFGVWQLKKLAGREYMGIVRTTFVVENGIVTDIIKKVDTKNANTQLFTLLDNRDK